MPGVVPSRPAPLRLHIRRIWYQHPASAMHVPTRASPQDTLIYPVQLMGYIHKAESEGHRGQRGEGLVTEIVVRCQYAVVMVPECGHDHVEDH